MGFCCNYGKKTEYENETEFQQRKRSHLIVFFTQFNVVISYSMILIGIWPYLNKVDPAAGKDFLGYLIGASALGQTIFSPIIGWWSNKLNSNRIPFLTSLLILIISHFLYASLYLFDSPKLWMLLSRFLAGVGSANFALCRSHIASTTIVRERRKVVAWLSSCATLSLAMGPAFQYLVVPLGEKGYWLIDQRLKLDMYTAVGWLFVILTTVNLFLFAPGIFVEHNMLNKEERAPEHDVYRSKNYKLLATLFIVLNFALTFNFMFLKVLGTPLVMDEYAMTRKQAITLNSIVVSVGAAISFVSILLINPICKFFSEMSVLVSSIILMIIGRFCFYPLNTETVVTYDDLSANRTRSSKEYVGCPMSQNWCANEGKIYFFQFILGNAFENVGYSIAMTLTMTIFSQVLGSKKQGTWMGFLTALGSAARITSPVLITIIYAHYGPSVVTLVTNIGFGAVCLFVIKSAKCMLSRNLNSSYDDEYKQQTECTNEKGDSSLMEVCESRSNC